MCDASQFEILCKEGGERTAVAWSVAGHGVRPPAIPPCLVCVSVWRAELQSRVPPAVHLIIQISMAVIMRDLTYTPQTVYQ